MAGVLLRKPRNVIPRWRLFNTTVALSELSSSGRPAKWSVGTRSLEALILQWQSSPSIWVAADALSAAFVLKRTDLVTDIAEYVLAGVGTATEAVTHLARIVLFGKSPESPELSTRDWKATVRARRADLREYPRDAVRWADLALAHTVCGNRDHALRCLQIALALAPSNRFILRAGARGFLHWGDPERAHGVLRSSPKTPYDPWLLAAEMAVASARDRRSKFTAHAKRLLTSGSIAGRHLSELATAFGKLEFDHGSNKAAVRLFRQALADPTENTVAQIEWELNEHTNFPIAGVTKEFQNVPFLFEARAADRFSAGDWPATVQNAALWVSDQPFSSRAASLASYTASLVGDYNNAIDYLINVLDSNPKDVGLLNNLTYFRVLAGRLDEALETFNTLRQLSAKGEDILIVRATTGLLEFRHNRPDVGRELYLQSIREGKHQRNYDLATVALANLAREEFLAGNPEEASSLLSQAKALSASGRDKHALAAEIELAERVILEKRVLA